MKTSILTMRTMFKIYIENWLISIRIIREHTKVHFEFCLVLILFFSLSIIYYTLNSEECTFFNSLKIQERESKFYFAWLEWQTE